MAKGGRPPFKITSDVIHQAQELASKGLTLEQVARCLGVCYDTLNEKSKEFPEFSEAIKKGKAMGISQIANVLFGKALSGDLTAAIFFLKCRAGWNDREGSYDAHGATEQAKGFVPVKGYNPLLI